MSQVHYVFIARDSDMIVFEKHINREFNAKQIHNEVVEIITQQEQVPEQLRDKNTQSGMEKISGSTPVECHMLFNIVFIGLVTDMGYGKEKVNKFLDEIHSAFNSMYKNNLGYIKRQQNLKPNVFYEAFNTTFKKINKNYDTGIKMNTINQAQEQVSEITKIAQRATEKQLKNIESGERLLATTQEMNALAQTYQKDAHTLEINVTKSQWWMCSKSCILFFAGGGCLLVVLILIIVFAICGGLTCSG